MTAMTESEALARLAGCYGILPAYHDIDGREHHTTDAARRTLLAAMGIAADSEGAVRTSLNEWSAREWRTILPPAVVLRDRGGPLELRLRLPARLANAAIGWRIVAEDGSVHMVECAKTADLRLVEHVEGEGGVRSIHALTLGPLAHGYYRLTLLDDAGPIGTSLLVVAPPTCYWPPVLEQDRRVWGPTAQLYTLRSRRNWGIGDFTDLALLARQWGSRGAGVVGLNPLHALFPDNPQHVSPYSPSNRLYLNALYLDPEAIPDFAECEEARALVFRNTFQHRLAALRAPELVDYVGVAKAKRLVLELLYGSFRTRHLANSTSRAAAFRAFQDREGRPLRLHALFEALQERFRRKDESVTGWLQWPPPYRHPAHPSVARFEREHGERIEFFEYLQWNTALQLEAAKHNAQDQGMQIGLYGDLAVSVDPGGAEVWSGRDYFAMDASVGCPPDALGPAGQDWGLPPLLPHRLAEAAYEPFIRLLRANMAQPGALRLDHVMGLRRLFWIPRGSKAADGAYVSYPFDDLLGILALESHRNRCLVVGEDLGTVPDEVRVAMARERILSYRVLIFEREHGGDFKAPQRYEPQAIVAGATHDLPTLAGFWTGRDLVLREQLGLFANRESKDAEFWNRNEDRHRLLAALQREGLSPGPADTSPGAPMPAGLSQAVHAFLGRTPCKVMVVQVEDVIGVDTPVNVPGTINEYPNWRRKLPVNIEELSDNAALESLTTTLRAIRGTGSGAGG